MDFSPRRLDMSAASHHAGAFAGEGQRRRTADAARGSG
jgi:hypothetical protein